MKTQGLSESQNIYGAMNNSGGREDELDDIFDKGWVKQLTIYFHAVLILLIVFENGLVLLALKRFASLRKPANMFIGGLAIADFCMAVPLTLKIVQITSRIPQVCVAQGITMLVTVCCISLHLACIAVERFISIKYSLRYDSIVTKTRIYVCIVLVWTFTLAAAFVVPVTIHREHFENLADGLVTLCSPKRKPRMSELPTHVFHYAKFMLIVFFAVPCVIILLSNTYIFIASSRQRRKIIRLQSSNISKLRGVAKRLLGDLKAARILFLMQALFIAAYFPYFAVTVHRIEHSEHNERSLFRISKSLSFFTSLTSSLNPLIYASGNGQFRKAFRKLLKIGERKRRDVLSAQQT
jgi:uncharacterized membrane protein YidH (DUF202 family)